MNVFLLENFYNPFLKMIHYYDVLDGEIYQNSNKDHFVNLNKMLLEKSPENAKMFQNIYSIFEELKKHNLSYDDAINPNNYGYKNNAYAIFDIGYGDKLNYKVDVEKIDEDSEEMFYRRKKNIPPDITKKIFDFFKVDDLKHFNSGQNGDLYEYNNMLLKITKDANEAVNAKKILNKRLKHIAEIYQIYRLKHKKQNYYILLIEKLKPASATIFIEKVEQLADAIKELKYSK